MAAKETKRPPKPPSSQIRHPGAPNDGPIYGPPPTGAPMPLNVGSGERPKTDKPGTGRDKKKGPTSGNA